MLKNTQILRPLNLEAAVTSGSLTPPYVFYLAPHELYIESTNYIPSTFLISSIVLYKAYDPFPLKEKAGYCCTYIITMERNHLWAMSLPPHIRQRISRSSLSAKLS